MATVNFVGTRSGRAAPSDEQDGEGVTLGEWLRSAREARGLTLDRITQETRIPQRHLEAIEDDNLSLLPEFYQRSEVRAIARAVGLDELEALARLHAAVTPSGPEVDVPPAQPARRRLPSAAMAIGAVVLGAFVLGVISGRWSATLGGADIGATAGATATGSPAQAQPKQATPAPQVPPADSQSAATTAPAPALPGATTVLVVTSEPAGARVTVNGIGWGVTPVAIRHLPPGDKRVRVSKEGYRAAERVLALDEGSRRSVAIELPAAP